MNITIIGGSGLVGNGIRKVLEKNHQVFSFNSSVFDKKNNSFNFQKFTQSDLLIFSASVTDEEVMKKDVKIILDKYKLMLKNLIFFFKKKNLKYFTYISSIHVNNYEQSNFLKKNQLDTRYN
jgi:aspartate-semialdehyde dehydrogenase